MHSTAQHSMAQQKHAYGTAQHSTIATESAMICLNAVGNTMQWLHYINLAPMLRCVASALDEACDCAEDLADQQETNISVRDT